MKFFFLSLLFSLQLSAKSPNDYDHENKGCPLNSTCSKELGILRIELIKLLGAKSYNEINSTIKKTGFLMPVWLKPEVKSDSYISWDSSCPEHQKEKKFQIALAPIKNFNIKSLSSNQEIFYPYLYLENGNSFTRYLVPRNAQPIYISGKDLYFAEELEGKYYGIKISENGNFSIIDAPQILERSHYIDCPTNLKEITKEEKLEESPYTQYFCKEIWNKESKKFLKVIIPYSCS